MQAKLLVHVICSIFLFLVHMHCPHHVVDIDQKLFFFFFNFRPWTKMLQKWSIRFQLKQNRKWTTVFSQKHITLYYCRLYIDISNRLMVIRPSAVGWLLFHTQHSWLNWSMFLQFSFFANSSELFLHKVSLKMLCTLPYGTFQGSISIRAPCGNYYTSVDCL